jgi:hypothetical protein
MEEAEVLNETIGRATTGTLRQAKAVVWKDEGEDGRERVGPTWIRVGRGRLLPFCFPDTIEWFQRSFAADLAETLGVPLVES